jgi:hypothetical protein
MAITKVTDSLVDFDSLAITGDAEVLTITASTGTSQVYQKYSSTGGNHYIGVANSAGAGLLSGAGAYSLNIQTEGARNLALGTNNSLRMLIDSSGNVGIGTSSPSSYSKLDVAGLVKINSSRDTYVDASEDAGASAKIFVTAAGSGDFSQEAGHLVMQARTHTSVYRDIIFAGGINNAGPLMTIKGEGDTLIGRTSVITANDKFTVEKSTGAGYTMTSSATTALGGTYYYHSYIANGSQTGYVSSNGSTTSYNTSSDYRLKENVVTDWDATTRLKQLKPSRFNFIADAETTVDGFLAHEVEDIVPEAITGTKDATETLTNVVINNVGNVIARDIEEDDWIAGKEDETYPSDSTWEASHTANVYQGIDQAKLVPLLVKTIQELEERITTLENA